MKIFIFFLFIVPVFAMAKQEIVLNGKRYPVESVQVIGGVPHIKTKKDKKLCTPVNLNAFKNIMEKPQRTYHFEIKKPSTKKPKRTYHIPRKPASADKKSNRPPEEPSYQ